MRLSPDGSRLAVTVGRLNFGEVWIYDLKGSAQPIKLTFRGGANFPVWRPDGGAVFYHAETGLYSVVADGSVIEPDKVLDDASAGSPEEWSPDGVSLLYQVINAKGGTGSRTPRIKVAAPKSGSGPSAIRHRRFGCRRTVVTNRDGPATAKNCSSRVGHG